MKKLLLIFGIVLFTACSSHSLKGDNEIIIGGIVPLSAGAIQQGKMIKQIIDLRIKQINMEGGIQGHKLAIKWKDGKCNYDTARVRAQELLKEDVNIILGGVCSEETLGAASITNKNEILLLSPVSISPKISDAGEYVFRTAVSIGSEGNFVAEYLNKNNYQRVGVLEEYNSDTPTITASLEKGFAGEVVKERFSTSNISFEAAITTLIEEGVEIVFLNTYSPRTLDLLLENLKKHEYKNHIMGNSVASDTFPYLPNHHDYLEELVVRGVVVEEFSESKEFLVFKEEYYAEYNEGIISDNTGQTSLDAIDLVRDTLMHVENRRDSEEIIDYLSLTQMSGVSGAIRFDNNGDVVGKHKIMQFVNNKFIPLEK